MLGVTMVKMFIISLNSKDFYGRINEHALLYISIHDKFIQAQINDQQVPYCKLSMRNLLHTHNRAPQPIKNIFIQSIWTAFLSKQ